jgi:hypoxanthine phosphoribosyltransferase
MNRAQRKYLLDIIHKKRIEKRNKLLNAYLNKMYTKVLSQWEEKEWEYMQKQGKYLLELDKRYW